MIMEKKNNSLRYVAGACFGIVALIYINGIVRNMQEGYYRSALWTLVSIVGYALIAVSMFASVNILTSAGGGILAVGAARVLISNLGTSGTPPIYLITGFIWLVVCILFVVIGLNRKNAKMICIVAGVLLAVRLLLFGIYFAYYGLGFEYFIKGFIGLVVCTLFEVIGLNRKNAKMICIVAGALLAVRFLLGFEYFLSDIADILEIVGIIMMGLALNIDDAQDSSSKTASTSSIHSMTPAESQTDRLAKLKDLLDNGVISQEEFDAKKKQILGQ